MVLVQIIYFILFNLSFSKFFFSLRIGDQPTTDVWDFENEWSEGLCGCCTNRGQCKIGNKLFIIEILF